MKHRQRVGRCLRAAGLDAANAQVKDDARGMCAVGGLGVEETAAVLTITSEAVSNWYRHNVAGDLEYELLVGPDGFEQVYTYESAWFETVGTLPDAPSCSNMGIAVMRGLCASAEWSFDAGKVRVALMAVW